MIVAHLYGQRCRERADLSRVCVLSATFSSVRKSQRTAGVEKGASTQSPRGQSSTPRAIRAWKIKAQMVVLEGAEKAAL